MHATESFPALRRITVGVSLSLVTLWSTPAAAQVSELVRYIPPGANSVVVVDVESLLSSRLAARRGWAERRGSGYAERPVLLPPEAQHVVIGAQLDTSGALSLKWEAVAMDLNREFSIDQIALPEGGYVDTIGGIETAWTPSNAYILDLEGNHLGIMYPADRQAVSRWIEFMGSNQPDGLSEYLRSSVAMVSPTTQVVIAIDLQDAITPHRVRAGLSSSPTFMQSPQRIEQLVPIIVSARGVTLSVSIDQEMRGRLQFDFGQDPLPFASQAKDFVLEVLQRNNAALADIENWTPSKEGNSIILEGTLSEGGLRRLASLLDIPTTKFSDLADVQPAEPGTNAYAVASVTYFQSVHTLIEDLRETLEGERKNQCVWMDRFARRIDALPILNVDEELLDWGATVAETLRVMSVQERTANVQGGVRVMEAPTYSGYYGYDGYGYATGGYYDSTHNRYTIRAQERAESRIFNFQSWSELENATSDIRRAMTQKYGVEF